MISGKVEEIFSFKKEKKFEEIKKHISHYTRDQLPLIV